MGQVNKLLFYGYNISAFIAIEGLDLRYLHQAGFRAGEALGGRVAEYRIPLAGFWYEAREGPKPMGVKLRDSL
jgi:hypothetical protein